MTRRLTVAVFFGLALMASIASIPAAEAQSPPPKKFTVLLPFKVGITFFPISVADQLGYFKDEGITLDLQVANGSSAVVQQLAAGNAQIGVILAPNTLLGFAEGVKYKAFYDFVTKNTFDVKVVDSSPINKLADLKG